MNKFIYSGIFIFHIFSVKRPWTRLGILVKITQESILNLLYKLERRVSTALSEIALLRESHVDFIGYFEAEVRIFFRTPSRCYIYFGIYAARNNRTEIKSLTLVNEPRLSGPVL